MLSALKDKRRRTKQQILQTLGFAEGGEDSDFMALYAEYKATVNGLARCAQDPALARAC